MNTRKVAKDSKETQKSPPQPLKRKNNSVAEAVCGLDEPDAQVDLTLTLNSSAQSPPRPLSPLIIIRHMVGDTKWPGIARTTKQWMKLGINVSQFGSGQDNVVDLVSYPERTQLMQLLLADPTQGLHRPYETYTTLAALCAPNDTVLSRSRKYLETQLTAQGFLQYFILYEYVTPRFPWHVVRTEMRKLLRLHQADKAPTHVLPVQELIQATERWLQDVRAGPEEFKHRRLVMGHTMLQVLEEMCQPYTTTQWLTVQPTPQHTLPILGDTQHKGCVVAGSAALFMQQSGAVPHTSDVDVFVVGPTEAERKHNFHQILTWLASLHARVRFVVKGAIVTAVIPGQQHYVQVIYTQYTTATQVVLYFDLACCRWLYYQGRYYTTPSGLAAKQDRLLVWDEAGSGRLFRYAKYAKRNFVLSPPISASMKAQSDPKAFRFYYPEEKEPCPEHTDVVLSAVLEGPVVHSVKAVHELFRYVPLGGDDTYISQEVLSLEHFEQFLENHPLACRKKKHVAYKVDKPLYTPLTTWQLSAKGVRVLTRTAECERPNEHTPVYFYLMVPDAVKQAVKALSKVTKWHTRYTKREGVDSDVLKVRLYSQDVSLDGCTGKAARKALIELADTALEADVTIKPLCLIGNANRLSWQLISLYARHSQCHTFVASD